MKKKALIFGVKTYWDGVSLPSKNLVKILRKKDYEVFYISDPISPFHFLKWGFSKEIVLNFFSCIFSKKMIDGINNLSQLIIFPHFINKNKLYLFLMKNLRFTYKSKYFKMVLSQHYDFVFSCSFRNFALFKTVQSKRKIFSIEDNPFGFGNLDFEFLTKIDAELKSKSKPFELYCTSMALIKEKYKYARYITNGIPESFKILPQKIERNYKCVYVGTLDFWFDWDLINSTFAFLGDKEQITLDIYGISSLYKPEDRIKTNYISFKGPIKHDYLQNTLRNYSVGLIPFINDDLIKYVNPIKYFEYLSAGLVTVSSEWKELKIQKYPYLIMSNNENFISSILDAFTISINNATAEKLLNGSIIEKNLNKMVGD